MGKKIKIENPKSFQNLFLNLFLKKVKFQLECASQIKHKNKCNKIKALITITFDAPKK